MKVWWKITNNGILYQVSKPKANDSWRKFFKNSLEALRKLEASAFWPIKI